MPTRKEDAPDPRREHIGRIRHQIEDALERGIRHCCTGILSSIPTELYIGSNSEYRDDTIATAKSIAEEYRQAGWTVDLAFQPYWGAFSADAPATYKIVATFCLR